MKHKAPKQSLHKKNIITHTENRARERYGLWLQTDIIQLSKIVKAAHKNQSSDSQVMFLYKENRATDKFHYLIDWHGKHYWIVWNTTMETIQTFMPLVGLVNRIGRFTNSVVGFLMSRGLVSIDDIRVFSILRVIPSTTTRKEILKNDAFWERNDQSTLHQLNHNQSQQQMAGHCD